MESESWSVTETVNGSHEFVIEGYSLLKGMGIGRNVKSREFEVGGHKWMLCFFPDGKYHEDNTKFISVYLTLVSPSTDVRAIFSLTLLDQTHAGYHMVTNHLTTQTFRHRGSIRGYRRLIPRNLLETSPFIKNDRLKMKCTIGVVMTSIDVPKPLIKIPKSDIGSYFGKLLENEKGSDVTFLVGEERFRAQKLVLTARSTTLFKTKFLTGMKEDGPIRENTLLHFIYTDTLIEDEELLMPCSEILPLLSESFPGKLLVVAQKYGFRRLQLMCQSVIAKYISMDSVADILAFADHYRAEELKSICLKFSAAYNTVAVVQSDGFEYPNKPLLEAEEQKIVTEDNSGGEYVEEESQSSVQGQLCGGDIRMNKKKNGKRSRKTMEDYTI
ncbi:hypothetical protein Fmac_029480 [Flemingia macrophylla]|uniref:Uncharacterized protein n=1 Tax=Flemingia macrophylla TaxID=520843 RepID=A0ABD1LAL4_9FABA